MQMNYQNNSRDFFFHLLLQHSARGRTGSDPGTLLALRSRCRSSSRVAEQKSQKMWLTCREGQWRNPGGTAGGAAAALRATEWHWHTGTQSHLLQQHSPGSATWDPLHRAECEPETATATAPRFKRLQRDVSHCKAVRNVLLCPVSLASSKFRAFKHTALPTATGTFSSRIAQLSALL